MQDKKDKFLFVLAHIVKKHRERANLSINQASHEIDLSKSIWSVIEQGKRDPQLSTLWKISEVMNIPLSLLIKDMEIELGQDFFIEN